MSPAPTGVHDDAATIVYPAQESLEALHGIGELLRDVPDAAISPGQVAQIGAAVSILARTGRQAVEPLYH